MYHFYFLCCSQRVLIDRLQSLDPQYRLELEVVYEALESGELNYIASSDYWLADTRKLIHD